jgi:Tol biopolymer transport system component
MSGERFREAKRVFGAALDRDAKGRAAYVREACGRDVDLRKEVEALLAAREAADAFFADKPLDALAPRSGKPDAALREEDDFTGRTLSHYAISAKIGEGGMGVVYLARDCRLGRSVALKVLSPALLVDSEHRRRFVQEATAASALNHPNIVTTHDIDTAEGVTFIVMEYVKGRTLNQVIAAGRLPPHETLKYAVQIADALSAAHEAGLVHRDIKPANIMVSSSGLVKLLDFGLAKLSPSPPGRATRLPAESAGRTDNGLIMGTVAYMSPEQAQGRSVDARSDIFSLGTVLYEMTTGRRAFAGDSNASTLAAIVGEEPEPLRRLDVDAPRALHRVIKRCLEKDRERRFQDAAELKAVLLRIAGAAGAAGAVASGVDHGSRGRRWSALASGALVLAAALALVSLRPAWRRPARPEPAVSAVSVLPGSQAQPALSPDGRLVAFVWNGDIYVQVIGATSPRRVTFSPDPEHSAAWSSDARRIAFLRSADSGTEVVVVPSAGGLQRVLLRSQAACGGMVLAKLYCGPAWSSDGRSLAVVDRETPRGPDSIFLIDVDTGTKQRLTTPPPGSQDGLSVFSPDGRCLAFSRRAGWPLSDIYVLPLTARLEPVAEPARVTRDNSFIWGFDWTADGRSLVFASSRGGVESLWRVAMSGGAPEGLPVGGNDALWPSVARKGNRLAYTYGRINMHPWRVGVPGAAPTGAASVSEARISYSPRWDQQPDLSPDGRRVAWASTQSGSHQIWVSGIGGEAPEQLTSLAAPGADMPRWSPDGRAIAFRGFTPGPRPDLYVIAAEGGTPKRLTTRAFGLSAPAWSADGHWLYFSSDRGEGPAVWKVPSGGGALVLVARNGADPVPSRDGNAVYYAGLDGGVWRVSAQHAGQPVLLAATGRPPLAESPDGRTLYFRGTDATIRAVPATGGQPTTVLRTGRRAAWAVSETGVCALNPDAAGGPAIECVPFGSQRRLVARLAGEAEEYVEPIPGTAVTVAASRDGRWLVYLRHDSAERKIMLVEHFR